MITVVWQHHFHQIAKCHKISNFVFFDLQKKIETLVFQHVKCQTLNNDCEKDKKFHVEKIFRNYVLVIFMERLKKSLEYVMGFFIKK